MILHERFFKWGFQMWLKQFQMRNNDGTTPNVHQKSRKFKIFVSKIDVRDRPWSCLNFVQRICGTIPASKIDSLVSELATDKAISKSNGWIQRKTKKTIANAYLAQTHHFRKRPPVTITCLRAVNRQPWFPRGRLVETACQGEMHRLLTKCEHQDPRAQKIMQTYETWATSCLHEQHMETTSCVENYRK